MLLGNADIEEPLGIGLGELGQAGAFGHGGGHGHDAGVFGTQFQQGLSEDLRVGGGCRLGVAAIAGGPPRNGRTRGNKPGSFRPAHTPCPWWW